MAALAAGACAVLAGVPAVLDVHAHGVVEQLTVALGVIAAALFLGAGVLGTARWRILGDPASLLTGSALVVLGGLAIPMTSLAGVVTSDSWSTLRAVTAVLTTSVPMVLVLRALVGDPHRQPRPVRLLAGAAGAAVGLFLAVVAVHVGAPQLLETTVRPEVLRGSLLGGAWLYLGLTATGRSVERPWAGRVAPLLGCMGVAEVLLVVGVYHPGGAWELAGAALVAALAGITTTRALVDLHEATSEERQHLDAMVEALRHSRAGESEAQAWREEMVHDARNALAGLRAALATLDKYDAVLDAPTCDRLRAAALGEIGHLEHLITRSDHAETADFDLAPVVANVVETQRAAGLQVDLSVEPARVHGHPGDVATALQNLLVNARTHGGGRVSVHVARVADRVEVRVADRGPGLATGEVPTLFQRGTRGAASGGSGLGLHVSRTLMRRHGGDLQLRGHRDGAAFAIVLSPAAPVTNRAPERPRTRAPVIPSPGRRVAGQPAPVRADAR